MLVELKNGETLNGHLVQCDTWMNLTLKEVIQTSPVRSTRRARRAPLIPPDDDDDDDWKLMGSRTGRRQVRSPP